VPEEVIFRFHLLSPLFVSLGKEERKRRERRFDVPLPRGIKQSS
jgi:hypothetical protein